MTYYNTNKEKGDMLKKSEEKTQSQEDIIYHNLLRDGYTWFTAEQVWRKYFNESTPLTSIRRAITDLCAKGKLEKTDDMTIGMYGKRVHYYRIHKQLELQWKA